ncbi:hypothetical protein L1049_004195 [Liquidambar formosana]|uniref:Response regulatory domain-containing protein n=1 Tax=Liquidambar formosana TaxID=63359 RepID=A0AAP0RNN1_LIQFO
MCYWIIILEKSKTQMESGRGFGGSATRRIPNGKSLEQGDTAQGNNNGMSNGHGYVVLRNRLTALVVDDDRICRTCEKALLESYGVDTQAVENGRDAVDLFASGASFNLVLMAKVLPVMNGLEATRQIRAMGIRSKILAVTAAAYERERRAFLEAGADEFIEKPLTPQILVPILLELDNN